MEQKKKKDQGFSLFYWNLSYRRKFFRTLWFCPLIILAPIYVYVRTQNASLTAAFAVAFAGLGGAELFYNYRKWKEEEKQQAAKPGKEK